MSSIIKINYAYCFESFVRYLIVVFTVLCVGTAALAGSPQGDVVGKVTVGYQGWFSCAGDGAPIGGWWHYSGGATPTPIALSNSIHCWPDVRQFSKVYQTGFTNFGNGQPATLFSSYDQQTVDTQYRWMAENGIDTAALQRFNPYSGSGFTIGGEGPTRDDMAVKVMNAAQTYGVKFYIMYDVSGWTSNAMPAQIKYDWTNVMVQLKITNSPMYAMQNGKPVVCIWGLGMNDANHPWTPDVCLDVVSWFKSQGCYVIGGVRRDWRTVDATYLPLYNAMNMISPWLIGAIGNISGADSIYNNFMLGDQAYCNANGLDYQPCILPGDTGQRVHGNLMWEMFYNAKKAGVQGLYISMYDEFNEGNQISCTAENASMAPVGSSSLYFTLDQDGTACSSDYYLRLTGDGGRMVKGGIALTSVRPTVPMLPVILPPPPVNLVAQGGTSQVILNWAAVTGAADALSYNVKRALVSGGSYTIIATNVGHVSYTDAGLGNNTNYYYVVSAVNSLGEGTNSIEASAMPAVAYQVNSGGSASGSFTADAYFSASSTSSTGAGIDTSAVTNPAPQAVYQSERYANGTGSFTYTFTNLAVGVAYKVRLHFAEIFYSAAGIRVFNVFINGTQVLNNFDIFATAGTNYKAVIKEFTATANVSGQIIIQYSSISGKDNAKSSGIEILPLNATQLLTPTGLVATAVSSGEISLNWTAAPNVSSYNVKRTTTNGGPYINIATGITEPAYWDNGLAASTTYYYVVSAVNFGESTNSVQANATTQVLPSPVVPYGLTATSGNGQVILNWTGSSWATGYYVKRSTTSGGSYIVIATNLAGVYYTNTGLANGTKYYFVVSATNAVGGSANSSEVNATPGMLSRAGWVASASASDSASPPINSIDGSLSTRWSTGASQVNGQWFQMDMGTTNTFYQIVLDATGWSGDYPHGYQVTLSNDGINWSGTVAAGTGNSAVTTITFAAQSARYIRVTQTLSGQTGNWWSIDEFNVFGVPGPLPAVPTGLTAVAGDGQAALSWNHSANATGYNVKLAPTSGGPYVTIASNLPVQTYTNTGLADGTVYYFAISATNSVGESSNSVPASVRPVSLVITPLGVVATNGQMQFAWPTDHTGWSLQAQTSSLAAGIGTNWVTVPASETTNQVAMPISSGNPSVFYRLVSP